MPMATLGGLVHGLLAVGLALGGGLVVLLAATIVFDVIHVTLHRLEAARTPWLRSIGGWHAVHHRFLGPDLAVDRSLIAANIRWHVLPEYGTHLVVTTALLLVLPPGPVVVALGVETFVVLTILRDRGLDVNHRPRSRVPAYRPTVVCLPAYHALHHVWPTAFYGSWVKLVDQVLGTTVALRGREAAVVGAPGPLRAAIARTLGRETGEAVTVSEPPAPDGSLDGRTSGAGLLVLLPSPETPDEALCRWIESAVAASADRLVPVEVWAVLPAAGAFAAEGRGYLDDARVIYRHVIVTGRTGRDPEGVARTILARVHRGAHRIHTGSWRERLRDWAHAWRGVRPARHGPRVAALA